MPKKTYSREVLLRLNTVQCQQSIPNLPIEVRKQPVAHIFWAPYTCKPVNDKVNKEDLDRNPPAIRCN